MAPFLHQNRVKQKWHVCKRKNKRKERFVCGMRDQVNTFDPNCSLYHERECVKFHKFELREKVTRETVHCCCVQMYTATLTPPGRFFTGERFLSRARVP